MAHSSTVGGDVRWRIELFGTLRAVRGDTEIRCFATRRVGAVLARLAISPTHTASREELIDLFWPEMEIGAARHNLRQTLFSLRKALDRPGFPSAIGSDHDKVWLDPEAITTDVEEFEAAARSSKRLTLPGAIEALTQAASLYSGELLADRYDEWILNERRRLEAAYLAVLSNLQRLLAEDGDPLRAAQYALRVVASNPYEEEARLTVMQLFAAAGRTDLVERQLVELREALRQDMNAEPARETIARAQSLLDSSRAVRPEAPVYTDSVSHKPEVVAPPVRPRRLVTAFAICGLLLMLASGGYYSTLRAASNSLTEDARFRQLSYLRESLVAGRGDTSSRSRHAELCLQLSDQAWSAWYGPQEEWWVRRLEEGQDDIRLALRWFLERDPEKAMRLAGATTRFWYLRDHAREGHHWLVQSLEAAPAGKTAARARALVGAAFLSGVHGEAQEAQCREAFDIYRGLADVWGEAHALRHLGFFASERQQYASARRHYEEALERFSRIHDRRGEAVTLLCLGHLAPNRDDFVGFAQARAWGSRSLALFRKIGNAWGVSMATAQLGRVAMTLGRDAEADQLYLASMESDPGLTTSVKELERRTHLCLLRKQYGPARKHLTEALVLARDQGDRVTVSRLLFDYSTQFRDWESERSVRLLAASAALDMSLDARQAGPPAAMREDATNELRRHLAPDRFEAAYREGGALSWTEAVDEVLMALSQGK